MYWYYAEGEERRGPVETAALVELLNKRTIDWQTLVWREGMADWMPLEKVRAQLTGASGPGLAGLKERCIECGRSFPESDLLQINQFYVCAECKGVFLEKLARGDAPGGAGTLFRTKLDVIVAPVEAHFPERCVKCNGPCVASQYRRRLYWHHPAFYLLIFGGVLIYAIVAMVVRKRATVFVSLCEEHRRRRTRFILIAWLLLAFGILVIPLTVALGPSASDLLPYSVIPAVASLIASGIIAVWKGPILKPTKIDDRNAYLSGAGVKFLAQLPRWIGP